MEGPVSDLLRAGSIAIIIIVALWLIIFVVPPFAVMISGSEGCA